MRDATNLPAAPESAPGETPSLLNRHPAFAMAIIAAGVLLACNLLFGKLILRDDNDAMLRLVQVRDLLAGQGWFDMQQYRMGLPGGFEMHWSRIVDAPIAAIILLGRTVGLDGPVAEAVALMAWPALVSLLAFYAIMRITRSLGGEPALLAALIFALPAFFMLGQFRNGAIDHHGPQIALALTVLMAFTALGRTVAAGLLAGAACALMAGIGIETNLHVVMAAAAAALLWLAAPDAWRGFAVGFGAAFAAICLGIFFGTIGPQAMLRPVCDAFSISHALPGIVGGAGLAAAALLGGTRVGFGARLLLLCAAAVAALAAATPFSLACVKSPLAGLDPLVHKFWLAYVEEAKPFLQAAHEDLAVALAFAMPALVATVFAVASALRSSGRRVEMALLGGAVALSLAIAFYQFRAIVLGAHLAVPALALMAAGAFAWANRPGHHFGHRLAFAAIALAGFGHAWLQVGAALEPLYKPKTLIAARDSLPQDACSGPAFTAALAGLPATTLMAVSNLGPLIVLDTPHRAVAGPYHRNVEGIKAAIQTFTLPADEARAIITATGATHLVWCPQAPEIGVFKDEGGFAAAMLAGNVPQWLAPVAKGDGYTVFELR